MAQDRTHPVRIIEAIFQCKETLSSLAATSRWLDIATHCVAGHVARTASDPAIGSLAWITHASLRIGARGEGVPISEFCVVAEELEGSSVNCYEN